MVTLPDVALIVPLFARLPVTVRVWLPTSNKLPEASDKDDRLIDPDNTGLHVVPDGMTMADPVAGTPDVVQLPAVFHAPLIKPFHVAPASVVVV